MSMQDLLPAVLAALRESEDEVAMAVVPFLVSWVARLKSNQKRTGGVPTVSHPALLAHAVCLTKKFTGSGCAYTSSCNCYCMTVTRHRKASARRLKLQRQRIDLHHWAVT